MRDEVDAHVLDVEECSVLKVANQMRRYPKDTADFIHLKFPSFGELRFIVRHGHELKLHAFFQNVHQIRVG